MTVTVYTPSDTVDKIYTDVTMCVLNETGVCQLMRVDDGVSHLDTFKADGDIVVQRTV